MFENFELNVISRLPEFNGRYMKKYSINGMPAIGAYGSEPFEIEFKNNSYEKIQVKISLDGTDVQTGKLANSSSTEGGMWVVNPQSSMVLKAWPETNKSGSRFVFTSDENSVAKHTHGIMSSKGIIAAAVYTESAAIPRQDIYNIFNHFYKNPHASNDAWKSSTKRRLYNDYTLIDESASSVSIGAGETVNQEIKTVSGLIAPKLSEIIRIKYLWWNELKESLVKESSRLEYESLLGFPGDAEPKKMADLGSTPRIKTSSFKESLERLL